MTFAKREVAVKSFEFRWSFMSAISTASNSTIKVADGTAKRGWAVKGVCVLNRRSSSWLSSAAPSDFLDIPVLAYRGLASVLVFSESHPLRPDIDILFITSSILLERGNISRLSLQCAPKRLPHLMHLPFQQFTLSLDPILLILHSILDLQNLSNRIAALSFLHPRMVLLEVKHVILLPSKHVSSCSIVQFSKGSNITRRRSLQLPHQVMEPFSCSASRVGMISHTSGDHKVVLLRRRVAMKQNK